MQSEVISGRINPSPTKKLRSFAVRAVVAANCRGRIYPSRGMHVRQFGVGVTSINAERGNLGTDKSVPYETDKSVPYNTLNS
ncbi:MAG: hypothetical protein FWG87_10320 [Defluviitaleaceae bacterium]|nr:hypothetical protein [Defluviitaleaceae bacterium]